MKKYRDYSVTLVDGTGRTCELFINGDSVDAELAQGVNLEAAQENLESNAFWREVRAGHIGEDAWVSFRSIA